MNTLIQYLKPYRRETIVGSFFKLVEAVIEVSLPTMMAHVIDNGIPSGDRAYLIKMGLLMLGLITVGLSSAMICQYNAARASQGYGTLLRNTVFKHIAAFSYADLDRFGTSSLINRITNDINQLQLAVAMLIRLVIRAPFICIGSFVMAMFLNARLALVLLAAIPLLSLILYLVISNTTPIYRQNQRRLDRVGVITRENLAGVRVIRAFARSAQEALRFRAANTDLSESAIRVGKISALLNPLTTFTLNVAILAVLWFGGFQINTGTLTQGEMIAFVSYITAIVLALVVVSNLVIIYTKAFASADRVAEVLNTPASIANPAEPVQAAGLADTAIELRQVSFGYDPSANRALTDINVTIARGQVVGILGGTGSGKSTLVQLIARLYEASAGEVYVNGVNVKQYDLHTLRGMIGFVPQKAVLFSGTVAENIRWGKADASDAQVIAAAVTAQADEFIRRLPDGYQTHVERGGQNFSGGQRQRLTIARALVAQPQILILDDSSSALDFATDAALRHALRKSTYAMTVLIVSQRVSSVMDADKILVMDNGNLLAEGRHAELYQTCPEYREICLTQISESEAQA